MRTLIRVVVVTAALVLAIPVAGVQAAPALGVSFEVPTTIGETGPSFGPFTASGNAVDAGLVCPDGDTIDVYAKATGYRSPSGINIQVIKEFTCADGSGTFLVKLQVRLDHRGDNFAWTILGGTGAYAALHGSGTGYGVSTEYGVLDHYEGLVH